MVGRNALSVTLVSVFVLLAMLVFLVPLVQTIFTSMKPNTEIYRTPVRLWADQPTGALSSLLAHLPLDLRGRHGGGGDRGFPPLLGEFTLALILNTKRRATTLPIGIMTVNQEEQAWAMGPISAVMILSVILPMTLYFSMQRYFVRSLMEGSLKG